MTWRLKWHQEASCIPVLSLVSFLFFRWNAWAPPSWRKQTKHCGRTLRRSAGQTELCRTQDPTDEKTRPSLLMITGRPFDWRNIFILSCFVKIIGFSSVMGLYDIAKTCHLVQCYLHSRSIVLSKAHARRIYRTGVIKTLHVATVS